MTGPKFDQPVFSWKAGSQSSLFCSTPMLAAEATWRPRSDPSDRGL